VELRLLIWRKTFQSRHVEVESRQNRDVDFISRAAIPSVLEVCQESRNFALPFYPLCFGSSWYPPIVRFNLSIDVLYLTCTHVLCYLFGIMNPTEASGLRYIAIESTLTSSLGLSVMDPSPLNRTESGFERALRALPGLRELNIVYDLRTQYERRHCRSVSCTTLCEDVPYGFSGRWQRKVTKQLEEDKFDSHLSGTYRCRSVYGVKQCHCTHLESELDEDAYGSVDSESEDDDDAQYMGDHWGYELEYEDYEYGDMHDELYDHAGAAYASYMADQYIL
jgi:hypothetical protein